MRVFVGKGSYSFRALSSDTPCFRCVQVLQQLTENGPLPAASTRANVELQTGGFVDCERRVFALRTHDGSPATIC